MFSSNCTFCVQSAFVAGLGCDWCPGSPDNFTAYLSNGTCVPTGNCTVATGVTKCSPPPIITITPCPDNCLGNGDCSAFNASTCFDSIQNFNETDIDCGGYLCYPCKPGQKCMVATDCFTNICDNVSTFTCGGSGFFQAPNQSLHCVCNPGFTGSNCGIAPLVVVNQAAIIGGTVSAVAIVGIVLALVICAGIAGGGSYAMYNKMNGDAEAPVMSNPLYKAEGTGGQNPIFQPN